MLSNEIACVNAFILKASEKVPSASVFLAQLAKEAGVPDKVLNVVHRDKIAANRLITSEK
jgi:malonate-semialdehyde dehydrogenase (acetylating) / methylmalonate-semialdehyde dehydrogenase